MPIDYSVDASAGVIYTSASGTLTDDELAAFKKRLRGDPSVTPGMKELSDMRGVTRFQVTPEGISQFVTMDEEQADFFSGHRLAIVASQDVVFGMARMYQTRTEQFNPRVQVFRDIGEAREWLGLPE